MEGARELFSHLKEEGLFHHQGKLAVKFQFGRIKRGHFGLAFTTNPEYPEEKMHRLRTILSQHEVLEGNNENPERDMANYREGLPTYFTSQNGSVTFVQSFRSSLVGERRARDLAHLLGAHEQDYASDVYAELFIDRIAQGAIRETRPMTRFKAALRQLNRDNLAFHSGEPMFECRLYGDKDHSVFTFNTHKDYPQGKLLQVKAVLNRHGFLEVPSGNLDKSAAFHSGEPVYSVREGMIHVAKRIPLMALEATPDLQYLRGLLQEHSGAEGEVRTRLADKVITHFFRGPQPRDF